MNGGIAWLLATWFVALAPAPTGAPTNDAREPSTPEVTTDDPWLAAYYAELQRRGLVNRREATLQDVQAELRKGQEQYVRGDALGSAVTLFDLTHDPRYGNFAELPEMTSAWYHLGVALQAYGAELTARAAYAKVLARGPEEPYFTPALRRVVDLALLGKDYGRGLREVQALVRGPDGRAYPLPPLDEDELDYLRARADQQGGRLDQALDGYVQVSPRSRFHTAGLYLQGTIYAERKQYREAEAKFCEVVQGPNASTTAFYVDRRYFPVRDLANLGLGRVAHEERRHTHAFFHYFQVPEDSPELPKALFEAAWTMAEQGEYAVARDLVSDLRTRYPDTPQAVEAELLDALLKLYDCDFRTAEAEFTRFIERMAPVTDHLDEIRKDPAKVRALHRELGSLRKGGGQAADSDAHRLLLAMLDEAPTYGRLSHRADVLRREAALAEAMHARAEQLQVALGEQKTSVEGTPGARALDALAKADDLERGVAGLERQIRVAETAGADPNELASARQEVDRLRGEIERLRTTAARGLVDAPPVGAAQTQGLVGALQRDKAMLERLRGQALALAVRLDDQAAGAAATQLGRLRQRIDDMMGEARMGRIDAVLGAKKKLEIEVQDMAAGRFPPELFGKLQIEGLIGDDEEFWPYEGEYWADEYEGYE